MHIGKDSEPTPSDRLMRKQKQHVNSDFLRSSNIFALESMRQLAETILSQTYLVYFLKKADAQNRHPGFQTEATEAAPLELLLLWQLTKTELLLLPTEVVLLSFKRRSIAESTSARRSSCPCWLLSPGK